jgi:hypothetical protein
METRRLGRTDLEVSRICFGCWQLSPAFWGEIPLDPWRQALRKALDLGVNFIDTADAYGDGFSETCLGDFLAKEGLRDRFVLATKFNWNFTVQPRVPDTRREYILQACEASLRRLKTDRIDLYQIHAWDPLTRPEEVAEALELLKRQGKIRWVGVSNLNASQMRMYQRFISIDSLQPHYNLLFRDAEPHELPFCLENQIGVIPYSPLYRGLLAGKYGPNQRFEDHRGGLPLFTGKLFPSIVNALEELRPMAEEQGLSLAQFAVRWVLTHPAVTSAIVGIKQPEHITSIVAAADGTLPGAVWHKAAEILQKARNASKE